MCNAPKIIRGLSFASLHPVQSSAFLETIPDNPLRTWFDNKKEGRGIMKWDHYLDVYHEHLQKFVGKEVHVLEVGVHSGGSLDMWRAYFGEKSHVYGIDRQEVCKKYENKKENIRVFIGSQEDVKFLKEVKKQVSQIDVLVDDGSHNAEHQIATLEEMLPYVTPGGVYIVEDVKGILNGFSMYMIGLTSSLNVKDSYTTRFQKEIESIHFYPFMVVIKKRNTIVREFTARKAGTEWQRISGKRR